MEFTREERIEAMRSAISRRNSVLIELVWGVLDERDREKFAGPMLRHKVTIGDYAYIREHMDTRRWMASNPLIKDCVQIAIQKKDLQMLKILFEKGCSRELAVCYTLQMCKPDDIQLLIEAGCKINFDNAIKNIVEGGSKKAPEMINWIMVMTPTGTLDRQKFQDILHSANVLGKEKIAKHMEKCLEFFHDKFSEPADVAEQ